MLVHHVPHKRTVIGGGWIMPQNVPQNVPQTMPQTIVQSLSQMPLTHATYFTTKTTSTESDYA